LTLDKSLISTQRSNDFSIEKKRSKNLVICRILSNFAPEI
jgi:hypothetical protein